VHRVALPGPVLQAERDVVLDPLHDELGGGVLEHEPDPCGDTDRAERERVLPVELQRSGDRGRDLSRDDPRDRQRERALAGARRADEKEDGTRLELELDLRDG
jgi:hypothetical protein